VIRTLDIEACFVDMDEGTLEDEAHEPSLGHGILARKPPHEIYDVCFRCSLAEKVFHALRDYTIRKAQHDWV
jgi:hypothetical protein